MDKRQTYSISDDKKETVKELKAKAKKADQMCIRDRYKGCELAVDQETLPPLAEGEYYFFQLKGLKAIDPQGNELGTVVRMEASAAQNLLLSLIHI